jgi:pimeloyl-ACP methyl ester carboxylesterase
MSVLVQPWPRTEVYLPTCTMAVRHAPALESGAPPAVFVHGLGGSSLNWTDLMDLMRAQVDGWAPDLGGFGASPPPRDGDMSPRGYAANVAEFIEQELGGQPVHLLGNSMGGAVALQLAARRPELVRSLTLISPAMPALHATRGNIHLPVVAVPGVGERLIPRYAAVAAEARVKATIDACFADPKRLPEQRMAEAVAETKARDEYPYAAEAFLRALRGLLKTFMDAGEERPWKLADRVQCPTLVVYGRKDPLIDTRAAHRVTRHFADSRVMVLPDCGHIAQMEHPELVYLAWQRMVGSA